MLAPILNKFKTSLDFTMVPYICDYLEEKGKKVDHLRPYKLDAKSLTDSLYFLRSNRKTHPDGEFDKATRFYPSDDEDPNDTIRNSIRSPTRSYPYSYMTACRTKKHCAELVEYYLANGTGPSDLMKIIRNKADHLVLTFETLERAS